MYRGVGYVKNRNFCVYRGVGYVKNRNICVYRGVEYTHSLVSYFRFRNNLQTNHISFIGDIFVCIMINLH